MRTRLDDELREMNKEMIELGALCEKAIGLTDKALLTHQEALAIKASAMQDEIMQKEKTLENLCLRILLLEAPMASDLRQVSAALKMVTDLRRIGEIAGDMSDIIKCMGNEDHLENMALMAKSSSSMVTNVINAFVKKDIDLAKKVIKDDDVIDMLFLQERNEIINLIKEEALDSAYAVDLIMIAKYYEKIGDHAVNLACWVIYSVTGQREGEN